MKTQYYTAASLDGFIADQNNSLDWLFQFGTEEGAEDEGATDYPEFISAVGAVAMGSTTYEWLLDNQIYPDAGESRPWPYSQPSWVFTSRELRRVEGADIRFVRGDVRPVHREMAAAAAGKNIWVVGGGELVGQFHDHGLLDEIIIWIAAVTLGAGAPLLPRVISRPPLRLVSAAPQAGGFVRIHYEVPRPGA
jgi:dihydrofolate reductase